MVQKARVGWIEARNKGIDDVQDCSCVMVSKNRGRSIRAGVTRSWARGGYNLHSPM